MVGCRTRSGGKRQQQAVFWKGVEGTRAVIGGNTKGRDESLLTTVGKSLKQKAL